MRMGEGRKKNSYRLVRLRSKVKGHNCPYSALIGKYVAGDEVVFGLLAEIYDHLSTCPECERLLVRLSEQGTTSFAKEKRDSIVDKHRTRDLDTGD